ncbi:reverse transcriptase domain, Reverse transcriptase zinc-binding domain protein [Artemisia annua]|uniref:Reverse transcriptase domain, Reverse transcriptase zinc-binding domain protein n=1 Tax=Artemisia annua TaxID=35608 RepID=A0A2U1LV42_ARTAN|nr:reverse transcriptase domain, Reverse transcriptase zinc-binding domain protein [Artemisia annua]
MMFKVDFEKAFDSVSWKFLDHMLSVLGFGAKWRSWIQSCLCSSRSSILINGSPTSEFPIKRGLRQGDPLSPFLFIIVMEGLHIALQNAVGSGLIRGSKVGDSGLIISHLFYADDVVITSEWNSQDMDNIIRVLHVFYLASGLKLNIAKSNLYGIGVSLEEIEDMAHASGCAPGIVPFTYLGLPIGSNMNSIMNWQPLIDRFHQKLSSWKANLLSIGGRLTLIKAVLGSLGIYYLSIFKCPESVLKILESIRASFFWGGSRDHKKMSWIKWDNILASYDKGGLNIGSLKAFNFALLQKWRWRLVTSPNSLWVRVVKAIHGDDTGIDLKGCIFNGTWANIVKSYSMLQSKDIIPMHTLRHKVGNGSSIRFWKDNWIGNGSLSSKYNRLFHLEVDANCLLSDRLSNGSWSWNWSRQNLGSRNEEALENLLTEIAHVSVNRSPDSWKWSIAHDDMFSVLDTRIHVDNAILPSLSPSIRWSKILPRKVNIFIWRLILDRLPNRLNLSSRGLEISSISCPLCNAAVESIDRTFLILRRMQCKISCQSFGPQ